MHKHNRNRARKAAASGNTAVPWKFFFITALCGFILAAGFFFAARQHFLSMDFGMKNSTLRKQIEDLEAEKRRLVLAKEISLSPVEVTRTARKLGFADNVELAAAAIVQPAAPQVEAKTERASTPVNIVSVEPATKQKAKPVEPKQLVVPVVQQTATKGSAPGMRPRVVPETQRQTSESTTKALSKL